MALKERCRYVEIQYMVDNKRPAPEPPPFWPPPPKSTRSAGRSQSSSVHSFQDEHSFLTTLTETSPITLLAAAIVFAAILIAGALIANSQAQGGQDPREIACLEGGGSRVSSYDRCDH